MTLIQSQTWSRRATIAIWSAIIIFTIFIITQLILPKRLPPRDDAKLTEFMETLKAEKINLRKAEERKDSSYTQLKESIERVRIRDFARMVAPSDVKLFC